VAHHSGPRYSRLCAVAAAPSALVFRPAADWLAVLVWLHAELSDNVTLCQHKQHWPPSPGARWNAALQGRTWNPAGMVYLMRNSDECAAFLLPRAPISSPGGRH
jgi:hypothetical protein